jgi:hypothetical protein
VGTDADLSVASLETVGDRHPQELKICAPEQSRNVRYRDLERSVDCPYAAGAFGFLIFSQTFDGPDLYGASSFFKTMPPSR